MFEKLTENVNKVTLEMKKLHQTFHFALNNYDYHHEKNEGEVIVKYKTILNDVKTWCSELEEKTKSLEKLLKLAKAKSDFYESEVHTIAAKHNIDLSALKIKDNQSPTSTTNADIGDRCRPPHHNH